MSARSTASRHPASPALGRNVISIASGKGGVGKTWLSITLAQALARAGRNVLLFDGDLGLANIDIQLGLTAMYDLGQVLAGRINLEKSVTRFEDGAFDVIAGRSGSGSLASLSKESLIDLRSKVFMLANRYDSVLIDLGAGIDTPVRMLTTGTECCLVVTTSEPTALTDAYAFIKVTKTSAPDADLRIVVNAADTVEEGNRTYETLRKACENFLKFKPGLAGIVRRDPKVPESIRNQVPLLTRHPNCEAAEDVERISRGLLGVK